jgi:NAD-dependent DNA ligase
VAQATLPALMHATNLFGRGFGVKKIQLILAAEPTLMLNSSWSLPEKVKRVSAIEGLAQKTAEQFIKQIPVFLAFLKETHLLGKLHTNAIAKDQTHPLYGKQVVLTGFRDKELLEKLKAVGAEQGSAVSKKTFVVLSKEPATETSKITEANALGILIMTPIEFKTTYKL